MNTMLQKFFCQDVNLLTARWQAAPLRWPQGQPVMPQVYKRPCHVCICGTLPSPRCMFRLPGLGTCTSKLWYYPNSFRI
jgi:hypothetical protein